MNYGDLHSLRIFQAQVIRRGEARKVDGELFLH